MNKALRLLDFPHFGALTDSFIGFDDLFKDMEAAMERGIDQSFPPYDIYTDVVNGETHTFIKFALAGIPKDDLRVEFDKHILSVYNVDSEKKLSETRKNIRLGIAQRKFSVTKQINESLLMEGAKYEDGCLIIEFKPAPKSETKSTFVDIK